MWNRIAALMILVGATSLLITPAAVEARGGGRGGGGGGRSGGGARGGGSYSGGKVMNRTPTMSRTSSRPATSQARPKTQARPATSQARSQVQARPQARQQVPARPSASQGARVQQRPSAANRTDLRNQVDRYAQSRPGQNPLQNADRQALSQRAQNFSNNRGSQIAQNQQLSNRASQRLQQARPDYNQWFGNNFFDRHAINADYLGTRANWWRPAAWTTLASWGNWGSTPYYYDEEGSAYPITTTQPAEPAYAYPTTPAPTYSQTPVQAQPTQTAATTPEGDWLPLGVFAVGNNANAAVQSNRFIQLAVSRSGEIAGVLYNSTTDAAQDLIGQVDPNTQKAYWSMANRTDSPIASTGIYNLTEDQTSINVHFANGSDQTWALVRLQQEADGNAIGDAAGH